MEFHGTSFEKSFCPLTRESCRPDCSWLHSFAKLSDDGVEGFSYCAVNVIANMVCEGSVDGNGR